MDLSTKQKQIHRLIEWTYSCQGDRKGERNSYGIWDGHVHIAIFKMDNQQGPTVIAHGTLFNVV